MTPRKGKALGVQQGKSVAGRGSQGALGGSRRGWEG